MWKRVALLCAALFLFVVGCSKAPRQTAPAALSPSPSQAATPGLQGPVFRAQDLFPRTDLALTYRFNDGSTVHENLLVDENRFVQSIDGKPYVTWFRTDGGIFRPDPSDPTGKGLLRYLPANLQDGLLWQQDAAHEFYYFRLSQEERCDGEGISLPHCWKLEVLNGVGVTTFHFAPGVGVVHATGDMEDVADSFDKRLQTHGPAQLPADTRKHALGMAPVFGAMTPVDQVHIRLTASGFQDELDRHRQRPACGAPSSGKPVAPGASGRVTFLCAGKLFSLDLATGTQRLLYAHSSPIHDFAWAPTGRGLAFAAPVKEDAFYWDAATGNARLIYPGDGEPMKLSWSADGEILVASPGTSAQRGFDFVDRATGQVLGHSWGIGLSWSPPVARRFATERPVDVPGYATTPGASRTLVVGDIVNGQVTERVVVVGTPQHGYSPAFFTADGTLIFEQFEPKAHKMVAWWSLPPGPLTQPAQLDVTSPLLAEVPKVYGSVGGKKLHVLGTSRDGQWSLIIFDFFDEVYLIRANLSGQPVRLPGEDHEWDPRH